MLGRNDACDNIHYRCNSLNTKSIVLFFFISSLMFSLLLVSAGHAKTLVINSKDWHDVYTGFEYGNLKGFDKILFFSGPLSTDLITALIPKGDSVVVIESKNQPFFKGYANYLKTAGFDDVTEIISSDPYSLNRKLAFEVDTKKFIVVSDAFGYDAISVAPYAYITNAWVVFANKKNVASVYALLKTKGVDSLLIYGHVNREVYTSLESFNPEIINTGNRFKDNLIIAEKFEDLKPGDSVIVTTGEFIEQELMTGGNGKSPVLFTGMNRIYPGFFDFLEEHNIKFVTIIGNELIPVGTKIREKTNKEVAVFVKFGQGFTGGPRRTGQVYALTMFPLPHYIIDLRIISANYDPKNKLLLVKYFNKGNMPAYMISNIHIKSDGNEVLVVNDKEPVFIEPQQNITVAYKADLSGYTTTNLTADFYTLYGEGPDIMDRYVLETGKVAPPITVQIGFAEVINRAEVELISVVYNKNLKRFIIKVKNTGEVNAFVDAQLKDVIIDGIKQDLFYDGVLRVVPGDEKTLMIKAELSEADILDNPTINVIIPYGEDKDLLTKKITEEVELEVVSGNFLTGAFTAKVAGVSVGWLIIIIIVIIIFFILKRRKRKE